MAMRVFLLLCLLPVVIHQTVSLSCGPCHRGPCESPRCCPGGQMVPTSCGCCKKCSSQLNEPCGGLFGQGGSCGSDMTCLRSCGCQTDQGKKCVFPFKYQNVTYHTCTTADSENGRPWCAVEVNQNGEVVEDRWEDCQTCRTCHENMLINVAGICVGQSDRTKIEGLNFANAPEVNPIFRFDEPTPSSSLTPVSTCSATVEVGDPSIKCRCASVNVDDADQLQCRPGSTGRNWAGFCFLENVADPSNPTENCYSDVQWSTANSRFWSNLACVNRRSV